MRPKERGPKKDNKNMRRLIFFLFAALAITFIIVGCGEDKRAAEIRRRATELAMQRTDSVVKIQQDSLAKVKMRERRRADSIAKVDSIRRIYERNHITLEGTVGGETARLRLNRNGDVVSGTYSGSGVTVNVHGTWNEGVTATGKQVIDSVTQTRVSINIQRNGNDEFTGSVTINKNGSSYTQRAVMQRY